MTFPKSTKWTFLLVSTHIKRYPTIKGGYGLWKSPNASWLLCKMKKKGAEICIPTILWKYTDLLLYPIFQLFLMLAISDIYIMICLEENRYSYLIVPTTIVSVQSCPHSLQPKWNRKVDVSCFPLTSCIL